MSRIVGLYGAQASIYFSLEAILLFSQPWISVFESTVLGRATYHS